VGNGENYITRSLMICTVHQISGYKIKINEIGETLESMGTGEMHSWFLWGDPREGDCLEDVGMRRW